MKGKLHSPEQAVSKLREIDRLQATEGLSVAAAAKRVEVAEWTVYRWRKQYGGMNRDDAKRLKELETENGRLKRLLADALLENEVTKEALRKKW